MFWTPPKQLGPHTPLFRGSDPYTYQSKALIDVRILEDIKFLPVICT